MSYESRHRYYEAMKRFCAFLADKYKLEKISNIAPKHIYAYSDYMKEKGLLIATVKTELSAVRFWCDQMPGPRRSLPTNDDLSLGRRSYGKIDRTWTQNEYEQMLEICRESGREDYIAIFTIARRLGLRIHEISRLDRAAAEKAIRTGGINVKGKNGLVRTIQVQEPVITELKKMVAITPRGHKLFVPQDSQTHIEIRKLPQFISAHRDKIQDPDSDRPTSMHGLRHSFAAGLYQELNNTGHTELAALKQVSWNLGHKRPEVTNVYLASLKKRKITRKSKEKHDE